jgi:hypothetical protein
MNFGVYSSPEEINYVYIKTSYMKDKCNDTKNNTAYVLFKVKIKQQKYQNLLSDIKLVDYYYYITDYCVFHEENITKEQLNMHVNKYCCDIFICKNYGDLCLVKSTNGTNDPEGIIPFGEHDNMKNLFIFYDGSKLNAKTLEGAFKEILFYKFMDEY